MIGTMPIHTSSDVTLYQSTVTYQPGYYGSSWTVAAPGIDTSDGTVNANSQILSDYTAYAQGVKYTGSMPSHTAQTEVISTPKTYQSGYYTSSWTVTPNSGGTDTSDATLASNSQILSGITAYSQGTKYTGSMPSITPTSETITTSKTYQSGYYAEPWTVTAGGTDTSDGTLNSNSQLLNGVIAYSKGVKYTGNIQTRSASNSTITSAKSYSAGYYANSWTVTPSVSTSGTASAAQILSGYTAWVNGSQLSGTMSNVGAVSTSINPGGTYTIPRGYHNGSGTVSANQPTYSGDAAANHVLSGKKFYSTSSTLQTGTMNSYAHTSPSYISPGQTVNIYAGYHDSFSLIASAGTPSLQETTIWSNNSPSASMAGSTISWTAYSIDSFDFVKIYWRNSTTTSYYSSMYIYKTDYYTATPRFSLGGSGATSHRNFYFPSNKSVTFQAGRTSGAQDNTICIPLSIIGITINVS